MAQMISSVDYHAKASVWSQDKWKGQFKVKWIYVKDVPNAGINKILSFTCPNVNIIAKTFVWFVWVM